MSRWEESFPPEFGAPARARQGLDQLLAAAAASEAAVGAARVVLSELVANAVRHARTDVTVSASIRDGVLRIEVLDLDTRPPSLLGLDAESTSGRGLHIVAGLAEDWGWQTADGDDGVSGKVVWAEIALHGHTPPEDGR